MGPSHPESLPGFEHDGTLRDIYVFGTSLEDWDRFLRFARRSYPTEFLVGLEPREMPDDPVSIFEEREHDPVLLRVFVDGVQLNCHFFWTEEIELDLDPAEVRTPEDGRRVLQFLKQLGDAINRPVVMTPEELPESPYYRYEPLTAEPVYCPD
jgi:hypothetical protein